MSDLNPSMQATHRRRRRNDNTFGPSVGTMVTTAVVAYGTYRLVHWLWDDTNENDIDNQDIQYGQESFLWNTIPDWLRGQSSSSSRRHQQQQQTSVGPNRGGGNSPMVSWRQRQHRLIRCREETIKAMEKFLPTIRKTIEDVTNTTQATKELKRLRAQQKEKASTILSEEQMAASNEEELYEQEQDLWDHIKLQTTTRMIATAYAHTMLYLVLTVQVHLLGGTLFFKQQQQQQDRRPLRTTLDHEDIESYHYSHRMVLIQTYDYFLDSGIKQLISTIHRAVEHVMMDWDVSNSNGMSQDDIENALMDIRMVILTGRTKQPRCRGGGGGHRRRRLPTRRLLRFLLPPEQDTLHSPPASSSSSESRTKLETNPLTQSILDETWDILESPILEDAQEECLNHVFDMMRDYQWGTIFAGNNSKNNHDNDSNDINNRNRNGTVTTTQPLAKVITQFKATSNSFYNANNTNGTSPSNNGGTSLNYLSSMERLPCVLELGDVSFQ